MRNSLEGIQAQKVLVRAEQLFPALFDEINAEPKPDPDVNHLVPIVKQRVLVLLSPTATDAEKKAAIRQLIRIRG